MQTVTTIGLDIAKSVFQLHGVDATGHMSAKTTNIRALLISVGLTALAVAVIAYAMATGNVGSSF